MDETLVIILGVLVIILIFMYFMNQKSYESFISNDPIESCKNLIKEKAKINKLSNKYCSKKSQIISNRDEINHRRNCYTITEKKANIDIGQSSWCSQVSPDQLVQIQTDISQDIINQEQDGPNYIENQYTINNIPANDLRIYNLSEFESSLPSQPVELPYDSYPNFAPYLNIKSEKEPNMMPTQTPMNGPITIPLYNLTPSSDPMYNLSSTVTFAPMYDSSPSSVPLYDLTQTPLYNLSPTITYMQKSEQVDNSKSDQVNNSKSEQVDNSNFKPMNNPDFEESE